MGAWPQAMEQSEFKNLKVDIMCLVVFMEVHVNIVSGKKFIAVFSLIYVFLKKKFTKTDKV